jgi:hypothetical protein
VRDVCRSSFVVAGHPPHPELDLLLLKLVDLASKQILLAIM